MTSSSNKKVAGPTPGPWTWMPDDGQFILDARGNIVAEIPCQGANPADGPLIAATPELLEALEKCVTDAEKCANPEARMFNYKAAEAAIKKAKGTP